MKSLITTVVLLLIISLSSSAQDESSRYEIDAKRLGVTYYDKDALPRSREFLRLDSTYYVGHFYEGMYKYDRAADYLGYRNAIAPLRKAFLLFEKDFKKDFSSIFSLNSYTERSQDARAVCEALYESYSNVEQADSAIWVLERIKSWNLPVDIMDYHIKSAWTIHRNRYYIGKYKFLKTTVQENEKIALNHLYEAIAQGNSSGYFYLAIIHNYLQNIDSTEYYYNYLMTSGMISFNNYGHFQNTLGKFALAIENFEKDKFAFDKRLIEAYYFLPTLYINSGRSLLGIQTAQQIITQNGSTPGFGWYNIALARSYLYNGQLDSCENAIDKAGQFKELHLGTTLGAAQYDFAVTVIKLLLINQKIERIKFQNSGWWYSPDDLLEISRLTAQTFLMRYVIINQFVNNPERQNVIYTLFSSENVIGFDEIWNVIKDVSPAYFTKLYKEKMETDPRYNIKRYLKLFYGNFLFRNGNESRSREVLEDIMYNSLLDTTHEKLFMGRLYEGLARNYDDADKDDEYNNMISNICKTYPQLLPYSGLNVKINLTVSGLDDDVIDDVVNDLKDCDLNFSKSDNTNLHADIIFEKKKDKYEVYFTVRTNEGKRIVDGQRMIFKSAKGVGPELALRLFGVNGPLVFDSQPAKN